ncbi:hypothetical protein GCM10009687_72210 [Asanoa iriomotensis]
MRLSVASSPKSSVTAPEPEMMPCAADARTGAGLTSTAANTATALAPATSAHRRPARSRKLMKVLP